MEENLVIVITIEKPPFLIKNIFGKDVIIDAKIETELLT